MLTYLPRPARGFPGGSSYKESACNAGDAVSITGPGRSPEGGNGNPLEYSCLENPMDREAWQATVYMVKKNQTQLKWLSTHTRTGLLDVLSVDAQEGPVKNAKVLAGSTMASCHFLQQFLFIPLDKIQITQQFLIHKDNSSSFREPSLPKSGAVSWTFTHTCLLRPHKQSIVLLHSRRRLRPGSLNKGLC